MAEKMTRRQWKAKKIEELKQIKEQFHDFVFFDFTGLDVPTINELRRKLRENEALMKVAKNTFIRMVFDIKFEGPTAVVGAKRDPIKATKIITEYVDVERIKGALLGGKFLPPEEARKLKDAPDFTELSAKLVGYLAGIISGLLWSLAYSKTALVWALKQIAEKKEKEQGAG